MTINIQTVNSINEGIKIVESWYYNGQQLSKDDYDKEITNRCKLLDEKIKVNVIKIFNKTLYIFIVCVPR